MSRYQRFRDSITGMFTTKAKAKASPDTTQATNLHGEGTGRVISVEELSGLDTVATSLAADGARRMRNKAMAHDLRVGQKFMRIHDIAGSRTLFVKVTVEISE